MSESVYALFSMKYGGLIAGLSVFIPQNSYRYEVTKNKFNVIICVFKYFILGLLELNLQIMLKYILLPHSFRKVGWCLLIPSTILLLIYRQGLLSPTLLQFTWYPLFKHDLFKGPFFAPMLNDLTDEILSTFFYVGAYFVGFSKEKVEDPHIHRVRMTALLVAALSILLINLLAEWGIMDYAYFRFLAINKYLFFLIYIPTYFYLLSRPDKINFYEEQLESAPRHAKS